MSSKSSRPAGVVRGLGFCCGRREGTYAADGDAKLVVKLQATEMENETCAGRKETPRKGAGTLRIAARLAPICMFEASISLLRRVNCNIGEKQQDVEGK